MKKSISNFGKKTVELTKKATDHICIHKYLAVSSDYNPPTTPLAKLRVNVTVTKNAQGPIHDNTKLYFGFTHVKFVCIKCGKSKIETIEGDARNVYKHQIEIGLKNKK